MAETRAARNRARRPRDGAFLGALARRARACVRRMQALVLTLIFTLALDPRSGGLISPAFAGPATAPVTQAAPSAPVRSPMPSAAIPGFHGPPPGFDGTSASGAVRAEP